MNATKTLHLAYNTALLAIGLAVSIGCTDGSRRDAILQQPTTPSIVEAAASFQFDARDTNVYQMTVHNGSLYMTGTPFLFSRWNITVNPENPILIFAASDLALTNSFVNLEEESWAPQFYGLNGLAVKGRYAYMSGNLGMSVIDLADTHRPKEVARYPHWEEGEVTSDPRFIYGAMFAHPSLPRLYGFRFDSDVLGIDISSAPNTMRFVQQKLYPSGASTGASSVAYFGGRAFLAMGNGVMVYDLDSNGNLVSKPVYRRDPFTGELDRDDQGQLIKESDDTFITTYQARSVYATSRYLYIHHQPTNLTAGSSPPRGIYVIDASGRPVANLPLDPRVFAVNETDTHIYTNDDGRSVRAIRINWSVVGR